MICDFCRITLNGGKKMKKRKIIGVIVLVLSLVIFSTTVFNFYITRAQTFNKPFTILYVPIDNRPISTYYVEKIAKISDVKLLIPPERLLGAKWERGDVEGINNWVRENMSSADAYIISTTMLNHGGLFFQRMYVPEYYENNTFSYDLIKEIKEKFPYKPLYAYSILQRHAVSQWNQDDLEEYKNIKEWAELSDKAYNLGDTEAFEKIKELEKNIPTEFLANYLKQRDINQEINLNLIDYVDKGYIDYLIFGQEDAARYGIHRLEQEKLNKKISEYGLGDKVKIICGCDEICLNLLTLLVQNYYDLKTTFEINYSSNQIGNSIFAYEDRRLKQTIEEHINYFGGTIVNDYADVNLYVYCSTESEFINEFINNIKQDIDKGIKVGIIDLSKGNNQIDFMKMLNEKIDLSKLIAYSSWNTVSNAAGLGISEAIAYNCMDKYVNKSTALSMHYNFLYERLGRDFIYNAYLKDEMNQIIMEKGEDKYDISQHNLSQIENKIYERLVELSKEWFSDFYNNTDYEYNLINVSLPWNRLFDIKIELSVQEMEDMNKDEI